MLGYLAQGCTNMEIAQALKMTYGSVQGAVCRILIKHRFKNRTHAAVWAATHLDLGDSQKESLIEK